MQINSYYKFLFLTLALSALFFSFSTATSAGIVVTSPPGGNLSAYWSFDASTINWGTNTISDLSTNGNNGTLVSMTQSANQARGQIGQSLSFDGNVNSIALTSNPISSMAGANSVCAWTNTTDASVIPGGLNQTFLNLYTNGSNGVRAGVLFDTGGLYVSYKAGGVDYGAQSPGGIYTNNSWVHVCYVWNGAGITLYANGVSLSTTSNTNSIGSVSVIGARDDVGDGTWYGSIDDMRVYSRALSVAEIRQIYQGGRTVIHALPTGTVKLQSTQNNFLNSGLVGYWSMNNQDINWSTGKLLDRSGQGNDGQMVNLATGTAPVAGKMGQALRLNGVDSRITNPINFGSIITGDFTIAFWVYPTNLAFNVFLYSANEGGANRFYLRGDTGTNLKIGLSTWNPTIAANVVNNQWQHYVVTLSGTTGTLYRDGIVLATQSGITVSMPNAPILLGAGTNLFAPNFLNGNVDEFRIYNRALSASDVSKLYTSGR